MYIKNLKLLMMKIFLPKTYLLFFLLFLFSLGFGQIPSGYYDAATGKTGESLRTALRDISANGHVKIPYSSPTIFDIWDAYAYTDVLPAPQNTIIWDMYSDKPGSTPNYTFTLVSDQCSGGASAEGSCYSREHCMPNSWWGTHDNASNPQYSDLHHLFACDQYVNQNKSNYPIGQTTSPTYTSSNGSKVGPCSYAGYTGVVFEPIDEYKGDFARAWLYLATRYKNVIGSWVTNYPGYDSQYVINPTTNNYFPWFTSMLIAWHVSDPVSQKEVDRNNAIYYNTPQHNRNPYIDHPEYVCDVWDTYCSSGTSITNVTISHPFPTTNDTVIVSANITDNGSVSSAVVYWDITPAIFGHSIIMSAGTLPTFVSNIAIPSQTDNTTVYYKIEATDNASNVTTTGVFSYKVTTATSVFFDDFSSNTSTSFTTSGNIGSSAWSVSSSGNDWGAKRNTTTQQLELTNDAGATANVLGWAFASTQTSSFSYPFKSILSANKGLVTWSFNLRQIRSDPAGFSSGSYGVAFILGGTSVTANNSGNGYAVVIGNSGATDPVRLVKYTNGLASIGNTVPPTSSDLIVSNSTGLTDFEIQYLSVKVTYDPSENKWKLYLRNDGTAFQSPATGTLTYQGETTDNTYTGLSLVNMGGYWQGSTLANQTAFFDNVNVSVDIYPFISWTGNLSTDWSNLGNWNNGHVPGLDDNVLIPASANNNFVLTGNMSVNDFDIQQGASLIIAQNGELTVNGILTNEGSLTLKSNAVGTGSLIHSTPNVKAKVEKFLSASNVHGFPLSTPVKTTNQNVFSGNINTYFYNSLTVSWAPFVSGTMERMRGYLTRFLLDKTLEFNDTLNTGDFKYSKFYRTGYASGNYGWNFIGNPYPSAINWDNIIGLSENGGSFNKFLDSTKLNSAIYLSDSTGGYYCYNNGVGSEYLNAPGLYFGGVIPISTAFWIQLNKSYINALNPIIDAQLTLKNSVRIHESASSNKKANSSNVIRLVLHEGSFRDETIIRLKNGATQQFDPSWDAAKMFSQNSAQPQLYSILAGLEYTLNTITDNLIQPVILPLGYKSEIGSLLTISAGLSELDSNISVYLEDKELEEMHNLRNNTTYSFSALDNGNDDRFVLHLGISTTSSNYNYNTDNIFVYTNNKALYISQIDDLSMLTVSNLLGQKVFEKQLYRGGLQKVNLNISSGNYIVSLRSAKKLFTQKVFFN